jgi:GNAT superfamily N-acetyltransferase
MITRALGASTWPEEARVRSGNAHAALVFDGSACVGWCRFGAPDELPRIKRKREYLSGAAEPPDWRITCFFVDSDHRRQGVSSAALGGALSMLERHGFERVRPLGKHHWVVSRVV